MNLLCHGPGRLWILTLQFRMLVLPNATSFFLFPTTQPGRVLGAPIHQSKYLSAQIPGCGEEDSDEDWEDDEGGLFFDDFGGQTIGSNDMVSPAGAAESTRAPSALQERIQDLQQQEIQKDALLLQNWREGNWQVRGFSLDPEPADAAPQDELCRAYVSTVAADPHDSRRIWIGRTNGSLLAVKLGNEYFTKFRSQLSASSQDSNGNLAASVSSQLVRGTPDDNPGIERPFEILQQCQVGTGHVSSIFAVDDYLFTTTASGSTIQQWLVNEDADAKQPVVSLVKAVTLEGAHGDAAKIVSLHALSLKGDDEDPVLLFSTATDGSLALWDLASGDLLYKCHVADDNFDQGGLVLNCADVFRGMAFVGTNSGKVLAYDIRNWIESASAGQMSCPVPNGQWIAGTEGAPITALACGGEGSLGRGRQQQSLLLLTGDAQGVVKQWEVLQRRGGDGDGVKLEQWPKLATQRLPKKAHVFRGHDGDIAALRPMDATKFLSAGMDGTVVAWNPNTGKVLFRMDGFTDSISSLCVLDDVLITDGMNQYVCVHDFDIDPEADDDFELDFEEQ